MKTKIKGKVILGALTCSMLFSQVTAMGIFDQSQKNDEGQKRDDVEIQIMSLDLVPNEAAQGEVEFMPISSGVVEKVIAEDNYGRDSEKLLITGVVKFNDLSGGFYEVDGFRLAGDYDFQEFEGRRVKVVGYKDDSPSIFMTRTVVVEAIVEINYKDDYMPRDNDVKLDERLHEGEYGLGDKDVHILPIYDYEESSKAEKINTITGKVKFNDLSGGFYEVDGFRLKGDYDFEKYEGKMVKVFGSEDLSPSIFMTKAFNVERIGEIDKERTDDSELSKVTKEIHQVENSETIKTYVDLYINEEALKLNKAKTPFIKDGRTLAPFRTITEQLGAKVSWDPVERLVSMQKGLIEIELVIDSSIAKVNGNVVDLDVPATIVNDRTFVPVRFLAEALNVEIAWEPNGNIVSLNF